MAIIKIHNLRYCDHTTILCQIFDLLSEIIEPTTLCYVQLGINQYSPFNIKSLWKIRDQTLIDLRDKSVMLNYAVSHKEYIKSLPAVVQAKLWNNQTHDKFVKEQKPTSYKLKSKQTYYPFLVPVLGGPWLCTQVWSPHPWNHWIFCQCLIPTTVLDVD